MSHVTCPACGGHLTVIHAGLVETHVRVPTLRRDDPWQTVRTLRLADFAACDRCESIEELSTTNSSDTRRDGEPSPAPTASTADAVFLSRKDRTMSQAFSALHRVLISSHSEARKAGE